MKKIIITCIILTLSLPSFSDCHSLYMEALREYNKGNYLSAQNTLVWVVKECGNYSDVFKLLTNCHKKLEQKSNDQKIQITQLKEQNKKLSQQLENYQKIIKESAVELKSLRQDTTNLRQHTTSLDVELDSIKLIMVRLTEKNDSLSRIADSLRTVQETDNNVIEYLILDSFKPNKLSKENNERLKTLEQEPLIQGKIKEFNTLINIPKDGNNMKLDIHAVNSNDIETPSTDEASGEPKQHIEN